MAQSQKVVDIFVISLLGNILRSINEILIESYVWVCVCLCVYLYEDIIMHFQLQAFTLIYA